MFSYSKSFLNKFQCVGLFVFSTGSIIVWCWIINSTPCVFSPQRRRSTRQAYKIQLSRFYSGSWRSCFLPGYLSATFVATNILVLQKGCQISRRLYRHERPLGAQDFFIGHKNKRLRSRADTSWAVTDHMKFNKSKCQVPCLGWDNPGSLYKLEDRKLESNLQETWGVELMASWTWLNSVAPKGPLVPRGASRRAPGKWLSHSILLESFCAVLGASEQ